MHSLYSIIANYSNAELLTLLSFGLLCFALLSFIWGNAKQLNKKLTGFQWGQVYFLGLCTFLSAVILLGKFIVPKNADSLLETLHVEGMLRVATMKFQKILLAIIKPMI